MTSAETKGFEMPEPKSGRVKKSSSVAAMVKIRNSAKKQSAARKTLLQTVMGKGAHSSSDMVARVRSGFQFSSVIVLSSFLEVSQKDMASILLIPSTTLARRQKEGRLHTDESDRVARLARIMDAAVEMMDGDKKVALRWLNTPVDLLGNESPLERAATEIGAREVESLITRIQHGVFS